MITFSKIIYQFRQSDLGTATESLPKSIADNIFDELRSSGLRDKDIVAISTELLGRLTNDIQERLKESEGKEASH